jgi:hypothetical protein
MYFYVPHACFADLKLRGGNPSDKSLDLLSVGYNSASISLSAVALFVAPMVFIIWHKTWAIGQPRQSESRTIS